MKKLVGEGKPFHSAVDKTAALLKRKVGTGAEFMKELMGVTGIKPTEINERGLTDVMGMPRMTHDQFMANLSIRPAPKIREKVFGKPDEEQKKQIHDIGYKLAYEQAYDDLRTEGENHETAEEEAQRIAGDSADSAGFRTEAERQLGIKAPYHGQYTLPGGDNYREMLIKMPNDREKLNSKTVELDTKLRHAAPENRSAIMSQIDELKAQREKAPEVFGGVGTHFGGESGILASMRVKDRKGPNGEKLLHLEELQSDWHQQGREHGYIDPKERQHIVGKLDRNEPLRPEEEDARLRLLYGKNVPDAPFKKNWEEMALKRLIHHAAEKGYHGVVVTPGMEQAKRYDLAQYVDAIHHWKADDGKIGMDVIDEHGDVPVGGIFSPEDIEKHVGKEMASKIFANEGESATNGRLNFKRLSGEGLTVGGKGMKAFYDTKVPNILNSIGKKYGVKTQLGGHRLQGSPEDYGNAVEKLGIAHIPMAQLTPEQNQKIAETADKRLHHFPITEEMRKDVLTNGLPLYNKGGTVHMADGGDMDQMQMAVMDQQIKKPKKPPTPLHFDPAPAMSKAAIDAHAERITRQMAGLENPNKKTLQQLAREQGLQVDIKSGGKKANLPIVDYSKLGKNAFTVGVPGDPSIGGIVPSKNMKRRHEMQYPKAGEYLRGVGGTPLESEVPMYGGYMYGGYGHPAGWASDLGASAGMFNVVKKLHEEDPTRDIYGHYHKMSPESLNHAVHIMDAVLMHHQPHNQPPEKIDFLNHLMRSVQLTKSDKDKPYPSFPGFENVKDVMLHGAMDSDMRKKIIKLLSTDKHLPGGYQKMEDLIFAASHPELRNIETGAGGSAVLKFDPSGNLRSSLSRHPTYGNDIPSTLIGKTRYTTPFQILAPRSHNRATQEIKAMGKRVDPFNMAKMSIIREPIDEQYINQMGEYEHAMRKRLGYKKGGKIKMADGGQVDIKNIGVNEAPDMDVKQFFAPRPMTTGVLPVGGVQQAPQAPQQMQQPPQAPQGQQGMQGMPQGQAPFQPPQAPPRQPPSNILQMTPQGQAMSAMTPPKPMARGGHVDRDTMMLELMNRQAGRR